MPVRKRLVYYGAQDYYRNSYGTPIGNQKVGVYLEIRNGKADHLGLPLPKGKVRVYKADASGSQEFVGEDWIDHTPEDERVKIKMGNAFDLVGERTQKDWRRIADRVWEVEWEIVLRNHKKLGQIVTVIEPVPGRLAGAQLDPPMREERPPHAHVGTRGAAGGRREAGLPSPHALLSATACAGSWATR